LHKNDAKLTFFPRRDADAFRLRVAGRRGRYPSMKKSRRFAASNVEGLYCQSAQNRQIAKFSEKRHFSDKFSLAARGVEIELKITRFITHGDGSSVRNRWRLK